MIVFEVKCKILGKVDQHAVLWQRGLQVIFEREQSPKPTVLAIGGVDYESVAEKETEEPVQLAASRRAVRWTDEALFKPLETTL